MGLLDNKGSAQAVYSSSQTMKRLKNVASFEDFDIKKYPNNYSLVLHAVYKNVAVFVNQNDNTIYISENGIDGDLVSVPFGGTDNFPNLIANSNITKVIIVPYSRRIVETDAVVYSGGSLRICVITDQGQIYHNYPSRAIGYDGASLEGDMLKFDESVVWDLPNRKHPVKTNTGDDASLIATGNYRYLPCLPNSMYRIHPLLNTDSEFSDMYGNGGFGPIRSYKDIDGVTKQRGRFWFPIRGIREANSFWWISGYAQDSQLTMIGTYLSDTTYQPRLCVFATNNGREWFVQWECGADGHGYAENAEHGRGWGANALPHFSEFGRADLRIKWDDSTMVNFTPYVVKMRGQWIPNANNKEPENTHKFEYGEAVTVASITSDSTEGIIVETATNHGFDDGEVVIFKKVSEGDYNWDWLCSEGEDALTAGNGMIWKIQAIDGEPKKFRLMLEIKNPEENLMIRHIHAINRTKDGYVISCGEEYPRGWVMYILVRENDSYANMFAGNGFRNIRLTSTNTAPQRLLGMELTQEDGNIWYAAFDTAVLNGDNVVMPEGRTVEWKRNSTGVFKGRLEDIDDFGKATCILESNQPAFFFKEINGIMVFIGMRGELAVSKDRGKSWLRYQMGDGLGSLSWLLGVDLQKRIYIRNYNSYTDILVVCPKV